MYSFEVHGKLNTGGIHSPTCACGIPNPMEFSGIKMESQTDDRQVLVGWKMWNQGRVAFVTTEQPE